MKYNIATKFSRQKKIKLRIIKLQRRHGSLVYEYKDVVVSNYYEKKMRSIFNFKQKCNTKFFNKKEVYNGKMSLVKRPI